MVTGWEVGYNSPMRNPPLVVAAITLALLAGHTGCSCMGGRTIPRPYPAPTADDVNQHLAAARARARSFQVESVMDYWVGKDRVKGTVLMMGQVGARMRINALNPTGGNVAADLACDGVGYQLIDYNNDCQLTGPCTRQSVAQLLRVSLEPDDFLLLVMGTTPVIADTGGTLAWDAKTGREVLTLTSADGQLTQKIALDGRDRRWDVLESEVFDGQGNSLWKLQNKDFEAQDAVDGASFRVPGKTRFTQPMDKADLLVRWSERTLNPTLDAAKFQMTIPPGLKTCGG